MAILQEATHAASDAPQMLSQVPAAAQKMWTSAKKNPREHGKSRSIGYALWLLGREIFWFGSGFNIFLKKKKKNHVDLPP